MSEITILTLCNTQKITARIQTAVLAESKSSTVTEIHEKSKNGLSAI
jgi:hypothetical protein